MAIGSMTTNSTVDMIDKTLKTENAPADAAATGAALDKKANKDDVLDPDGNVIFYSKADVEAKIKEILAAQREEDLARIKFWASNDPTSPASFIGGTWERIEDCTIWGASDTHPAGTTVEAGLPNITGGMSGFYNEMRGEFGALYYSEISNATKTTSATWERGKMLYFDASRSNSIYGASDTVQPPAYCLYLWKRVA